MNLSNSTQPFFLSTDFIFWLAQDTYIVYIKTLMTLWQFSEAVAARPRWDFPVPVWFHLGFHSLALLEAPVLNLPVSLLSVAVFSPPR